MKVKSLTGNEAAAEAMRQIDPDVVAAYPITPQTELVQKFADFVANGEVETEMILVESEHSAMSAVVGASCSGARAMTATSANGLALMWEIVYIAASLRCPIAMPVVNRALSGPINIHCDHSDSMGTRDSGWLQLYSENSQEVYDNVLQAVSISENPDVLLPTMITLDGFIISHTLERVEILDDEEVKEFIGTYQARYSLLDTDNPVTFGPLDFHDYYFEHKRQQVEAMEHAKGVILEVAKKYEKLSGRKYRLFDEYRMDGAETAIIALGSTAGTARTIVDDLRAKGQPVGLIKLRVFRPFPREELVKALSEVKAIAVLDRSASFGAFGGPVFSELRSALYGVNGSIPIVNYIYGLGGRDIDLDHLESVYKDLDKIKETGKVEKYVDYLGVRE